MEDGRRITSTKRAPNSADYVPSDIPSPKNDGQLTGSAGAVRAKEGLNVAMHGLRGITSVAVLMAHILGGTAEHIYADRAIYVEGIKPFWNLGIYGVMLFFMISGFVILPSVIKYSPSEFALRRFFRIYPLFLVATVLFAVLNALTNAYPDKNNWESIFFSLTFLDLFTTTQQIAPNAWSLSYEVMFYALACFTFWIFRRGMAWPLKLAFLALPVYFVLVFPKSYFFVVGAGIWWLSGRGYLQWGTWSRLLEVIGLVAMVALVSQNHLKFRPDDFAHITPYLMIFATGVYFAFAAQKNSLTSHLLSNPAFMYLGTVSYALYLVHPFTYFAARKTFVAMGLFGDHIGWSLMAFSIAVGLTSLIATHLAHITFERWPYAWFFQQHVYGHRP